MLVKQSIVLRPYQKNAINFLNDNDGNLVLAMCPSSGKTETIIYYLEQIINVNPSLKVLILPHSTNVLLSNFYERIKLRDVSFSYSNDVNSDANVHIVLPQNHNKITSQYDLIIVDEAHENYFAKTVQGIIKKTRVKKQILLTGTPYKFINNKNYKFYFVSLSDLDNSYIPKLRVDIIESDYDWNGNYNYSKELKNSFKFTKESTDVSLKRTFDFLLNRNNFNAIEKTMIVCRNISQSKYVQKYLSSIGFTSEISNSENDRESNKVVDFKNNLFDILIVVNRARLGYDDIDLINLIDISGTLNSNIIYQMFARLLRGNSDTQKYYIRLTSKNDNIYNSEIATNVALMLTHSKYISTFNGKNFRKQEIIVNSDFFVKAKNNCTVNKNSTSGSKSTKRRLIFDDNDSLDIIRFFKDVIDNKEKNLGVYKFCKIQEVLYELDVIKGISKTKEECIENALKYTTIKEWNKKDRVIHLYSYSKEWYNECIAHMTKLTKSRTKEECIKNALKYTTINEWKEKDSRFYSYAQNKHWLDECTAHMIKYRQNKSIEECILIAKKYSSKQEWRKNDKTSFYYANNHGWLDECTAHMVYLGGEKRTLQECITNAREYKTIKDWLKNQKNIYQYAQNKGWLDKCTSHMTKLIKYRSIEECIENAKNYQTISEWRKNNLSIYNYCRKKDWIEQCTAHMILSENDKMKINEKIYKYSKEYCLSIARKYSNIKEWSENKEDKKVLNYVRRTTNWSKECTSHMNKLRQSKTKEQCIANARKYNTIKDWVKHDSSFHSYAKNRLDWYDECIAHMDVIKKSHTEEECIEIAKKYKTVSDWRKNDARTWSYAVKKKWYNKCITHMNKLRKSKTKEECISNAQQYKTKTEWVKNDKSIYNYARRKEWYQECLKHMSDN
jgi:superfamily II DNA or RNA helicase